MQVLHKAGADIQCSCGGKGKCGTCRVRILERDSLFKTDGVLTGSEEIILTEEEKSSCVRLACQKKIDHDMVVSIIDKPEGLRVATKVTLEKEASLNPGVSKRFLKLDPEMGPEIADTDRVLKAFKRKDLKFSLTALRALPNALRAGKAGITVTVTDNTIVDAEPGDTSEHLYGLAIDLGTTTIVCYLLDLRTGELIGSKFVKNPQYRYGGSVIDRIEFAACIEDGLRQMSRSVTASLSKCINTICKQAEIHQEHVCHAVAVGNTTMLQFLLRIDASPIGESPYLPALSGANTFRAAEVGININKHVALTTLPFISGFVGSDAVAAIVATGLHKGASPRLIADLGTNSEIILSAGGKLWACSAAAGPAFEGAGIEHGMVASTGAICQTTINHLNVELQTIGNTHPKGICGSGLIATVGELLRQKLMDHTGRFTPENCASPAISARFSRDHSGLRFLLSSTDKKRKRVYISQKDIRNIQLAKSAVRAGIEVLLRTADVWPKDLEKVFLAGSFGSSLDAGSVLKLGLLPPLPADRISTVGNAAGSGAVMALLDATMLEQCEDIARRVKRVDLAGTEGFQQMFMKYILFPRNGG